MDVTELPVYSKMINNVNELTYLDDQSKLNDHASSKAGATASTRPVTAMSRTMVNFTNIKNQFGLTGD